MLKVGIIGAGRIGKAVFQLWGGHAWMIDDVDLLQRTSADTDVVVNCGPWHINKLVRAWAHTMNKAYLDFSEDTTWYHDYPSSPLFIPHCGLAPGAICILGQNSKELYCGNLPQTPPDNALHHTVFWSPEGMAHEYQGKESLVQGPYVYGFESFTTAGGSGTLKGATYRTLRWPGHLKVLKNCAHLTEAELAHLISQSKYAPQGEEQDMVVIKIDDKITTIYPEQGLSAIQYATASGGCVVLDLIERGYFPKGGFIRQEDIYTSLFWTSPFSKAFEGLQ